MIRAVVFDFDGVLANSEPLHFRAFREVLGTQSVVLTESEYYARYLGYDDAGAFRAIADDRGLGWDERHIASLCATKAVTLESLEHHASVLFPGVREVLARLAVRGPVAIASGAIRPEIERVLQREALSGAFSVLVAAEDTPASKPDPAPYRLALERLNEARGLKLAAAECVAIEDSRWGLDSARGAGLRTIAITNSYPREALAASADRTIAHLDEVTEELLNAL